MRSVDSLFASTQSAALHTTSESRCTVKSERGDVVLANKYLLIKGKYTYLMGLKWSHLHLLYGCLHNVHATLIIGGNTAGEKQRDNKRVSKSLQC